MKRILPFTVLALLVVTPRIEAGSTYSWTGLATGLSFQLDDYNNNQQLIPIPEPSSVTVSLSYDPSYWSGPNAPIISPPLGPLTSAGLVEVERSSQSGPLIQDQIDGMWIRVALEALATPSLDLLSLRPSAPSKLSPA